MREMAATAKYEISFVKGVARIRFLETPHFDDFIRAFDDLIAKHPTEKRLWDLQDFPFSLSTEEVEEIAKQSRLRLPIPGRVAILVSGGLGFGLARQYEGFRTEPEHTPIRVFRDEDAAIAWLNSSE